MGGDSSMGIGNGGPLAVLLGWGAIAAIVGIGGLASPGLADTVPTPYLRPQNACPQELEALTAALLRDLPSYANRVARRSVGVNEDGIGYGTMLVAGRGDLEPLDLSDRQFGSAASGDRPQPSDLSQLFLTTLERQYVGPRGTATESVYLQQYHWLFLTPGPDGWYLALMFSRLAVDPGRELALRPPTPPTASENTVVGQAVRLWLRDCRAGAVYPPSPEDFEALEAAPVTPAVSTDGADGTDGADTGR